jgi:hypothetical protein
VKAQASIFGFEYSSELFMTGEEVIAAPDEFIMKLQGLSFNAPMVCHDEIKFKKLLLGLPILLIYCDPNVHGRETYDKIMAADKNPDAPPEVMFIVSTCNKLPPFCMLKKDKPQALFVKMDQKN